MSTSTHHAGSSRAEGAETDSTQEAADRRRRLAAQLAARARRPGPLAGNQVRLHAMWRLQPSSSAYHETVALRLHGQLDTEALLHSLRALCERHEWLRSRIAVVDDHPAQVLVDGFVPDVSLVDLPDGALDDEHLSDSGRAWIAECTVRPFDLERGPVWRAALARLGPTNHLLLVVVHHVACDAASISVLLDELGERYSAACAGRAVQLATPASPRDVAAALRLQQEHDHVREALSSHMLRLAGADFEARVPAECSSAPGPSAVRTRRLPPGVRERIERAAQALSVSPFTVVTAALAASTSRTTGTDDLVVGVPIDLRWRIAGAEDTVSFLVETVAVRLARIGDRTLADLAAEVRDVTADALERPVPFEAVVGVLRGRGDLAPTGPPLHVYVNWLDGREARTLGPGGPSVQHVDEPVGDAKCDVSWTVVSTGEQLTLRLEHDAGRLGSAGAERLLDRAVHLLDRCTSAPDVPLGRLGLLAPAERVQLRAWEGRATAQEPATDLLSLVLSGLAPEGAVVMGSGAPLSAADLRNRVERVASALLAAGVRPDDRVAVAGHRGSGMVVGPLAVLRAGGTFVPLDPQHPVARHLDVARRSEVRAVVGPAGWATELSTALGVPAVVVDGDGGLVTADALRPPLWPERRLESTAYVLHTSGSSGAPKGVRVTDGAVVARSRSYRQVLSDRPVRFLLQSALGFDASIYQFWALASGGCVVVPPEGAAGDPVVLSSLIARFEVTDAFFVPSLYAALLDAVPGSSLRSLRRVCVGGDVMPPELARRHTELMSGTALLNVYGPTEVVVTSTAHVVGPADLTRAAIPIGRPHDGTFAKVLDRAGRRVAVGAPGELHLGGPCVAAGYDAGASDAFPFTRDAAGERWYATGDVVRWQEDGLLSFVGRRDRQVKVRGQRIELAEVEAAFRSLPQVTDVAVEVVAGSRGTALVAVVAPTTDGVREALRQQLPPAWVPERLLKVEELPRTPGGKLDRRAVRSLLLSHDEAAPAARQGDDGALNTATPSQLAVVTIIRELLDAPAAGLDDDFFDLGGNSLLAARLVGRLREGLGVTLQLHQLALHGTARKLSAVLAPLVTGGAAGRDCATLVPLRGQGSKAPLVVIVRDGESSQLLRQVVRDLEPDRPLWLLLRPLPPPGLEVPDLAEDGRRAARALLEQFSHGPVHLVGHSATGLVALETARALGERRGLVLVLDTLCPAPWTQTAARWLLHPLIAARKQLGLARRRHHPWWRDRSAEAEVTEHRLRMYQESLAVHRVRLREAHFPVTLLTTAGSRTWTGRDDLGWGRWCSDLTLVELDSDHFAMLLSPDVADTVSAVRRAVASAA